MQTEGLRGDLAIIPVSALPGYLSIPPRSMVIRGQPTGIQAVRSGDRPCKDLAACEWSPLDARRAGPYEAKGQAKGKADGEVVDQAAA